MAVIANMHKGDVIASHPTTEMIATMTADTKIVITTTAMTKETITVMTGIDTEMTAQIQVTTAIIIIVTIDIVAGDLLTDFLHLLFAFTALTLLVRCLEEHPACRKMSVKVLAWLFV